jgi:hypothetical protein
MSTGAVIALLAVGAILRFAIAPGSQPGLHVHVVGIVLMLAGTVGLLLSLLGRGPLNRRGHPPGGYRRDPPTRTRPTLTRQRGGYQSRPPTAEDQLVQQDKPPQ